MLQSTLQIKLMTTKALQLIDYLIRNGSEKVIDSAKEHTYELKALKSFLHIDDKGKDQVTKINNK